MTAKQAVNLIGMVYSTLPIKDGSVPIQDIMQAMGKNVVTPFTSHSQISLTSQCVLHFLNILCQWPFGCSSISVDVQERNCISDYQDNQAKSHEGG